MSEVATIAPKPVAVVQGGNSGSLVPKSLQEAMRLAEVMANARAMPAHLQGDVGSCFMIIEQSQRWQMSPFLVAQCTSNIGGKLCYEGKLIAAAITSTGGIIGEFNYEFKGDPKKPDTLSVKVSALRASDRKIKDLTVAWSDVKTNNKFWLSQPEQQLCYAGARIWARRWTPGPMLGVYAPEEAGVEFDGVTVEAEPEAAPPPKQEPPRRTVKDFLADLKTEFDAAEGEQEVKDICDKRQVQIDALKGEGRKAFDDMLSDTMDRILAATAET